MAQTPETKVKVWLRGQMKTKYPDSWHYAPPAGPFGAIGVADDIWVIKAGQFQVFVAIESKADASRNPTEPQVRYLKKIQSLNAIAGIMRGKDHSKLQAIMKVIDDKIEKLEYFTKQVEAIEKKDSDVANG